MAHYAKWICGTVVWAACLAAATGAEDEGSAPTVTEKLARKSQDTSPPAPVQRGGWLGLPYDKPWSVRLDIAGERKTNLATPRDLDPDELRPRTDECRLHLRGNFDYRIPIGPGALHLGYGFGHTLNSDTEEIDMQRHDVSAKYRWRPWADATATTWLGFGHVLLDSHSILSRYRVGGSLYARETGPLFGRIAYDVFFMDHRLNGDLDSATHRLTFSQILQLPHPNSYVAVGYSYTTRDADGSRFSFDGNTVFTTIKWTLGPRVTVTGQAAYGCAHYDGVDRIEGRKRQGETLRLGLRVDYVITPWWSVYGGINWTNARSNLSRQDFESTSVIVGSVFRI